MSKRSTSKTREKNGVRSGINNPMRTKRSRFAARFQYEVRFFWWSSIDEFRAQVQNMGGKVKFSGQGNTKHRHHSGRGMVAYMSESDFFILRMLGLDHTIWRAYRLVPLSAV